MVTVGEQVHAVDPENDERRKLSAVEQRLHVLVDDRVVDVRADLSARIGDERVKRDNLTKRSADRGIRRQPTRETRRRNSRRHGKKKAIGTQPDSPKGSSTGSAGRWAKPPGALELRIDPYAERADHRARPRSGPKRDAEEAATPWARARDQGGKARPSRPEKTDATAQSARKRTHRQSTQPEPAQSLRGCVVVDAKVLRDPVDGGAALVHRGNVRRDRLVDGRLTARPKATQSV